MVARPDEIHCTVPESAKYLHVSERTVWAMITDGTLPAYRVGPKLVRIRQSDLDAALRPYGEQR